MESRRETAFSDSLREKLEAGNFAQEISRWVNELVEKEGVDSLSFFIDANSTKAISGRIFFDISPAASSKSHEKVKRCEIALEKDLVTLNVKAIQKDSKMNTETLYCIADYMKDFTDIPEICEKYAATNYARDNANVAYGNNVGAVAALQNCLLGQAAYMVLEAVMKKYHKEMVPDVLRSTQEEIKQLKSEISSVEGLMVLPIYATDKKQLRVLNKRLDTARVRLADLSSDKRNLFTVNRVLDNSRKSVNCNVYHHDEVGQQVEAQQVKRGVVADEIEAGLAAGRAKRLSTPTIPVGQRNDDPGKKAASDPTHDRGKPRLSRTFSTRRRNTVGKSKSDSKSAFPGMEPRTPEMGLPKNPAPFPGVKLNTVKAGSTGSVFSALSENPRQSAKEHVESLRQSSGSSGESSPTPSSPTSQSPTQAVNESKEDKKSEEKSSNDLPRPGRLSGGD